MFAFPLSWCPLPNNLSVIIIFVDWPLLPLSWPLSTSRCPLVPSIPRPVKRWPRKETIFSPSRNGLPRRLVRCLLFSHVFRRISNGLWLWLILTSTCSMIRPWSCPTWTGPHPLIILMIRRLTKRCFYFLASTLSTMNETELLPSLPTCGLVLTGSFRIKDLFPRYCLSFLIKLFIVFQNFWPFRVLFLWFLCF